MAAMDELEPQVPATLSIPPRVNAFALEFVPEAKAACTDVLTTNVPPMVATLEKVFIPDPESVRLLNEREPVPFICCAPDLLRLIVVPAEVNVPPLFVQSPATL